EDGIRDFHVTGVQTCALPISVPDVAAALSNTRAPSPVQNPIDPPSPPRRMQSKTGPSSTHSMTDKSAAGKSVHEPPKEILPVRKIGRASCREGVTNAADDGEH